VLGELLLTAGAFVFLYLGWQLYLNNAIVGSEQTQQALDQSENWASAYAAGPLVVDVPKADAPVASTDVPAYSGSPANAEVFGTLIVPRFGADWTRPIAEGIGVEDVLNPIGIGHYPGNAMPGQVGNFAVAAHRTGHGNAFVDINQLDVGDSIYVETADGWYRYVFRAHEYVLPTGVAVLAAVPQQPGVAPTERIMTLTSCNPLHSVSERYIAYANFDSWTPRSAGPPAEIAHLYAPA
jgi:sortase A